MLLVSLAAPPAKLEIYTATFAFDTPRPVAPNTVLLIIVNSPQLRISEASGLISRHCAVHDQQGSYVGDIARVDPSFANTAQLVSVRCPPLSMPPPP